MPTKKWAAPELPPPQGSVHVPRRVRLAGNGAPSASQEAFDHLAELFLARYRSSRIRSFQAMWVAMEGALEDLVASRGVSEAQAHRLKEWMLRDLTRMAAALVRGPRALAEALRQAAARDGGALARLMEVLTLSADAVYRIAGESRGATIHTGDVTCSGALACTECGRLQRCRGTLTVEQCRNCHGDSFTKTF